MGLISNLINRSIYFLFGSKIEHFYLFQKLIIFYYSQKSIIFDFGLKKKKEEGNKSISILAQNCINFDIVHQFVLLSTAFTKQSILILVKSQ